MHTSTHIYHQANQELHGFLAYDDNNNSPRPAVLVAHDWTGRNEFACNKAELLAQMGYVGFALDVYGDAALGNTDEEKTALMQPLLDDRNLLDKRVNAALEAVKTIPQVDKARIAIIGFCFGGLCALDLARSGADIRGAVSFHGLLFKPKDHQSKAIKAKVLALHGFDDPMVKPEEVLQFCKEMDDAEVDWQMHMYGHVEHGFTNPNAHDKEKGIIYNARASQRAWKSMSDFLSEILT